jgi:hypothetical protein
MPVWRFSKRAPLPSTTMTRCRLNLTVERGRNALLADQQERVVIGDIVMDAIFSPVPKVNFVVKPPDPPLTVGSGGSS